MVESWDFTIGAIFGVVLSVVTTLLANYFTESRQTNKERKNTVKAMLRELRWIDNQLDSQKPSEISKIQTPVFDALIRKISLFDTQTIYQILDIYAEIHSSFRTNNILTSQEVRDLKGEIEQAMSIIAIELKW